MKGNRKQVEQNKIRNIFNPFGHIIHYTRPEPYTQSHIIRLTRKKKDDSVFKNFGNWMMASVYRFVIYALLGSVLISCSVIYGIIYISLPAGFLIGIFMATLFLFITIIILKATKK